MKPDETIGKKSKESTSQKIADIIRGDTKYRTYRNCLAFLAAEEGHKMTDAARTVVALRDVERLYAKSKKLSETQETQLIEMLRDSERALAQSIWRSYRYAITSGREDSLEFFDMGLQIQRSDRKMSDAVWETLVIRERLAPRIGPTRIISKDLGLWPEERPAISTKDLKDAFLTFTHLPMIPSIDSLRETIVQGIEGGQFAYARGTAEKSEFHTIKISSRLDQAAIDFLEDTYLLRPKFALELLGRIPQPGSHPEKPEIPGTKEPPPPIPPGMQPYESVNISSELDWKKWMEFHEAVLRPLINAGAAISIKVQVTGTSEEGISPNTVDIAIKDSLGQYGIPANINTKKKSANQ